MENNRLIQELVNIFDNMGINEKKSIDLRVIGTLNNQCPTGKIDKKDYEIIEHSMKNSLHNFNYLYDENDFVHLQRIGVDILH